MAAEDYEQRKREFIEHRRGEYHKRMERRPPSNLEALEAVAEAAKAWLGHLEYGGGRYLDGVPGELMDAVEKLDWAVSEVK